MLGNEAYLPEMIGHNPPLSVYSHIIGGASNGAIIVCHFDSPNTLTSTALVLPAVIDALRQSGYQLVTITELLTQ